MPDFYDEAARVFTKQCNDRAKKLGCEPPPEFTKMFQEAYANEQRQLAKKRKARVARANDRDGNRTLLRESE